jgi:hypothetical protein
MESTIPEGASTNPFQPYVDSYAHYQRNYHPNEYQKYGSYASVQVPEEIKVGVRAAMVNIQNSVLPTLNHIRNERNISQIQDRIYRKLKVYEEEFNNCQSRTRSIDDAYVCGNQLLNRLNVDIPQHVKSVINEY